MRTEVLVFGGHSITYYVWGNGPKLVYMLHGYGESGLSFNALAMCFPETFTLIAPDLPFHGASRWEGAANNIIEAEWLYDLLQHICNKEHHTPPFTLLGYSMGGRICMQLYENNPDRFNRLVLIAPDGMKMNFWYWLATQTNWGNKLFRVSVQHPAWFMLLVRWADKVKLVNTGIAKYVARFLNDEQARLDLYRRWTAFRQFRPHLKTIKKQIAASETNMLFVYGKYDKIIRVQHAAAFQKGLEHLIKLKILNAGHQLLQPTFAGEISAAIVATDLS